MKIVIFIITCIFSQNLIAVDIHQALGISVGTKDKISISTIKKSKNFTKPQEISRNNDQIKKLLDHTKVKISPDQKTSCGLKVGYKLSKKVSLSFDVMAMVDMTGNSSIIKSKEANIEFAFSI